MLNLINISISMQSIINKMRLESSSWRKNTYTITARGYPLALNSQKLPPSICFPYSLRRLPFRICVCSGVCLCVCVGCVLSMVCVSVGVKPFRLSGSRGRWAWFNREAALAVAAGLTSCLIEKCFVWHA